MQVEITTRHLLSHTSGIRHYNLKRPNKLPESPPHATDARPKEATEASILFPDTSVSAGTSPTEIPEDLVTADNFRQYVLQRRTKLAPFLNRQIFKDQKEAHKRRVRVI